MKYGLIGKKLSHSYSKTIHGFLGNPDYELRELSPDAVEGFLREADFKGVNVTIPYKETVMPFCVLDEAAKKIGSVNTIVNRDGALYGYNTDYFGFSWMAKRAGVSFGGKKAIILGSGGTSKTAAAVARSGGAREIVIVSRNGENNYNNIARHADAELLINTTPVGMFPNNGQSPLSLDCFTGLRAVLDVIYNPLRTRLLLDAKERGISATGGIAMLTAQAVRAHNLFFGVSPDEREETRITEEAVAKTEKWHSNIALVGMPGCGKTTIGRELARLLERDFIDTDERIEARTGRKIPDIIKTDGESRFRELERGVIAEEAARAGRVIATGGGAILAKENRDALLQNGIVFFLDRPLDKLATNGRPLSTDLLALYRQRLPLYESVCHHKIAVGDNLQDNVNKAAALL